MMGTGKMQRCRDTDVRMFKPRVRVRTRVSMKVKVRD